MRRGEMEGAAHYYREALEHLDRAQQSGTDVVDALDFLAQHTFVSSRCLCGSAVGSRCTAASCWRRFSTLHGQVDTPALASAGAGQPHGGRNLC